MLLALKLWRVGNLDRRYVLTDDAALRVAAVELFMIVH